jgi:hypothetical protein
MGKQLFEDKGPNQKNWLSESLKKVQLALSKGKKKKEMMLLMVRTSVSQDLVTATLYTEELSWAFSSPRILEKLTMKGGGGVEDTEGLRIRRVNKTHSAVPADLTMGYKVSDKTEFSVQLFSDWGR